MGNEALHVMRYCAMLLFGIESTSAQNNMAHPNFRARSIIEQRSELLSPVGTLPAAFMLDVFGKSCVLERCTCSKLAKLVRWVLTLVVR